MKVAIIVVREPSFDSMTPCKISLRKRLARQKPKPPSVCNSGQFLIGRFGHNCRRKTSNNDQKIGSAYLHSRCCIHIHPAPVHWLSSSVKTGLVLFCWTISIVALWSSALIRNSRTTNKLTAAARATSALQPLRKFPRLLALVPLH